MLTTDEKYMREAIKQAKKAAAIDEVPIGCVIVYEGKIIYNALEYEFEISAATGDIIEWDVESVYD